MSAQKIQLASTCHYRFPPSGPCKHDAGCKNVCTQPPEDPNYLACITSAPIICLSFLQQTAVHICTLFLLKNILHMCLKSNQQKIDCCLRPATSRRYCLAWLGGSRTFSNQFMSDTFFSCIRVMGFTSSQLLVF
ncbi:hypothetical protein YC2023_078555 [Brassica napus]